MFERILASIITEEIFIFELYCRKISTVNNIIFIPYTHIKTVDSVFSRRVLFAT